MSPTWRDPQASDYELPGDQPPTERAVRNGTRRTLPPWAANTALLLLSVVVSAVTSFLVANRLSEEASGQTLAMLKAEMRDIHVSMESLSAETSGRSAAATVLADRVKNVEKSLSIQSQSLQTMTNDLTSIQQKLSSPTPASPLESRITKLTKRVSDLEQGLARLDKAFKQSSPRNRE